MSMRKKYGILVGGMLFLMHAALVFRQFPIETFFKGQLPVRGDLTRYFMTASAVHDAGSLSGYDPSFMAGVPFGLWNSIGKKGYELTALLCSGMTIERAMYMSAVLPSLLGPVLLFASLAWDVKRSRDRLSLLAVLLAAWHFDNHVSYFWHFGNTMFPFASSLLVPFAYSLHKTLSRSAGWRYWMPVLAFTPAAIIYLHPALLPAVVLCTLAGVIMNWNQGNSIKRWLYCAAAAGVSLAILWLWGSQLYASRADYVPLAYEGYTASIKHLIMDITSDRVYAKHFDRNVFLQVLVLLSVFGIWTRRGVGQPVDALYRVLFVSGVLTLIFSYAGILGKALSSLQTYRLQVPGLLLILPVSAAGCMAVYEIAVASEKRMRIAVLMLMMCILPRFGGSVIDVLWDKPTLSENVGRQDVLEGINDLSPEGRILCDDIYLSHVVPEYTGSSVIGDGFGFTRHCFAGFDSDGNLFMRPAEFWATNQQFMAYMDLYAVEYIVLRGNKWKQVIESHQDITHMKDIGEYSFYKVLTFKDKSIASGACEVFLSREGVVLKEIICSEFVLKLHMPEHVVPSAGVSIEAVHILDDPVPFIFVRTELPEAEIKFSTSCKGRDDE